jgi:hypothetical protein
MLDGSVRACTPTPSPNAAREIECDFLQQSLDFEDKFGFGSPANSIKVTSFGTALGNWAINNCGPYCYAKNLTINVDIVGGSQAQEQGEVIVEFPATGANLPIPNAVGRTLIAWIRLDGTVAPPTTFPITAQIVLETSGGIVTGPSKLMNPAFQNWLQWQNAEFKTTITATTFSGPPVNVTGIGFRITGPANLAAGQAWHGLAYIDHLQVRTTGPDQPTDAGAYPYGL